MKELVSNIKLALLFCIVGITGTISTVLFFLAIPFFLSVVITGEIYNKIKKQYFKSADGVWLVRQIRQRVLKKYWLQDIVG